MNPNGPQKDPKEPQMIPRDVFRHGIQNGCAIALGGNIFGVGRIVRHSVHVMCLRRAEDISMMSLSFHC